MYDSIIVGAGPAGLSAAIYLRRANKKILIIEKEAPGGQLAKTDLIENYPGEKKINGFDLAYKMYDQTVALNTEYEFDEVVSLKKENEIFIVNTKNNIFQAKTVIFASGNSKKMLKVKNEEKFINKGISYCATCDGSLYKDEEVVVIGDFHHAIKEAKYLANICKKVTIITNTINDITNIDIKNVNILEKTKVVEFIGDKKLEKIKIYKDGIEDIVNINGAFIALGFVPSTSILNDFNILDEKGYIITNEEMETKIDGLFAVGDCRKKTLRQVVTAASDGAVSSISVMKRIK